MPTSCIRFDRHVTMIAIGGIIGTGLFLTADPGMALWTLSGPGSVLLSYIVLGIFVYTVMTPLLFPQCPVYHMGLARDPFRLDSDLLSVGGISSRNAESESWSAIKVIAIVSVMIVGLTCEWGDGKDYPGLPMNLELWRRIQVWQLTVSVSALQFIHVRAYGRSQSLNNLAIAVLTRFQQLGRMEDIEKTITYHREAQDQTLRDILALSKRDPYRTENPTIISISIPRAPLTLFPKKINPIPSVVGRALIDISVVVSRYFFAMSISSKIKRYYRHWQSRTDLFREQHTPEPERNSNSSSYDSTTSSISNGHNFSPANFVLFLAYVGHEEIELSMRPFLKVASRQLEAIQDQIKVAEAEAETEDCPSDSDEISTISQVPSRAERQRMIVGDNSRSQTLRPEYISAERTGKRRRTEDTLDPKPALENDRVVYDRTRKETDEFVDFLYFLASCALIFFLVFLFLLSVIFLSCLYVLHLSYNL